MTPVKESKRILKASKKQLSSIRNYWKDESKIIDKEEEEMKKQLMRSGSDQKIAGVCAGVANYFDIDPTIVRVIWGVLAFCYGAGIVAYIILWIIAPVASDY